MTSGTRIGIWGHVDPFTRVTSTRPWRRSERSPSIACSEPSGKPTSPSPPRLAGQSIRDDGPRGQRACGPSRRPRLVRMLRPHLRHAGPTHRSGLAASRKFLIPVLTRSQKLYVEPLAAVLEMATSWCSRGQAAASALTSRLRSSRAERDVTFTSPDALDAATPFSSDPRSPESVVDAPTRSVIHRDPAAPRGGPTNFRPRPPASKPKGQHRLYRATLPARAAANHLLNTRTTGQVSKDRLRRR